MVLSIGYVFTRLRFSILRAWSRAGGGGVSVADPPLLLVDGRPTTKATINNHCLIETCAVAMLLLLLSSHHHSNNNNNFSFSVGALRAHFTCTSIYVSRKVMDYDLEFEEQVVQKINDLRAKKIF